MRRRADDLAPTNPLADALLADAYEFTMAYAWWKNGHAERAAVADLYFRRNPFGGEFSVFAGLAEVVRFLSSYRFSPAHIERLRTLLRTPPLASLTGSAFSRTHTCNRSSVHSRGDA